jgi:hypothetical protein
MTTPRPLLALAAVAALTISATASAQNEKPAQAAPAAEEAGDGRGYEYKFGDDDLLGGGIDGDAPIIRVVPGATRSLLIRPRTSFVPELLLSADTF